MRKSINRWDLLIRHPFPRVGPNPTQVPTHLRTANPPGTKERREDGLPLLLRCFASMRLLAQPLRIQSRKMAPHPQLVLTATHLARGSCRWSDRGLFDAQTSVCAHVHVMAAGRKQLTHQGCWGSVSSSPAISGRPVKTFCLSCRIPLHPGCPSDPP